MSKLTLSKLQEAVRSGAGIRSRVALQPAGGDGTKVFPPTYAGAVYATEKRRLPGYEQPVDCVILDSVQSQANRLEEALRQAIDSGRFEAAGLELPLVEVDFTPFFPWRGEGPASPSDRAGGQGHISPGSPSDCRCHPSGQHR